MHFRRWQLWLKKISIVIPPFCLLFVVSHPLHADSLCAGYLVSVDLRLGEAPTESNDVILGTSGNDNILALGGDDIVCGKGGNDTIDAGPGNDIVYGGAGNDNISGGAGNDIIRAGKGDDLVSGNDGDDRIFGHRGNDTLFGNSGNDTIYGGRGDDLVHLASFGVISAGELFSSVARGGSGNDILYGSSPDSVLIGGANQDHCWSAKATRSCENLFVQRGISIPSYSLSDIGVADINSDGKLDIFTLNHSGRDSFLLGTGQGEFHDIVHSHELFQDNDFAGVEMGVYEPAAHKPGLYISVTDRQLVLRFVSDNDAESFTGSLELVGIPKVKSSQGAVVNTLTSDVGVFGTSTVNFEIFSNGKVIIRPDFTPGPYRFSLPESTELGSVFIGSGYLNPTTRVFDFELRDRHGAAWARSDLGVLQDVLIVRGGMGGKMKDLRAKYRDEYFVDSFGVYLDIAEEIELEKENCSARQVSRVDFDKDHLLDIYISCSHSQPNLLLHQQADGTFLNVASKVGLDIISHNAFVWVDTDLDGDSELVAVSDGELIIYTYNKDFEFSKEVVASGNFKAASLSVADYDNDADLDLLVTSFEQDFLLTNNFPSSWDVSSLESVGISSDVFKGTFVDYDNDGFSDISTVTGGLYRQSPVGVFKASGALLQPNAEVVVAVLESWFDYDNDGDRDVVRSVLPQRSEIPIPRLWRSELLENKATENANWLSIDLIGNVGNRSAIGTLLTLTSSHGTQIQQVGTSSEDSSFSQGHYRLYFGLGNALPTKLEIVWPDNKSMSLQLDGSEINQVLRLNHPDG